MADDRRRLIRIVLDEDKRIRLGAEIRHERAIAVYDLLAGNSFALIGDHGGPYCLRLGIQENRLLFDIRDSAEEPIERIVLPLTPLRAVIRDYFKICDTYYAAIKTATPTRIEAIDIGRRAVHDEGAEILRARLADRLVMDGETVRRLFTLICVLHVRDWR